MVRHAFVTDLVGAAALAPGVDQLDAVGVDDLEHGRSGQEDLGPVLRGPEEAQEPGALGEVRKQRAIVARQPALERPVALAFEGMQQPQGDHLTGPEVGLRMFGEARSCSSTSKNNAVINSTVDIRLSSQSRDGT
jgi:hypothetical protein